MTSDPVSIILVIVMVLAAALLGMLLLRGRREAAPAPARAAATEGAGSASVPSPPAPPASPNPLLASIPKLPTYKDAEDYDVDATLVTVVSVETTEEDTAVPVRQSGVDVFYDEGAATDEPTGSIPLILLHAASQSDIGKRRRRNEDSFLVLSDHSIYAIADGMGGYIGGDVASQLAVETICTAFRSTTFTGRVDQKLPLAADELVKAVFMANETVHSVSKNEPDLSEMGTTLIAARFSPKKQRCYIANVGDSRCYRLREGHLWQLTRDHTLGAEGVQGHMAARLSRAVGIASGVRVDLLVERPRPGDLYLLCSDGLSKMVDDEAIREHLCAEGDLKKCVDGLIAMANDRGGKDNVTAIVVKVTRGGR